MYTRIPHLQDLPPPPEGKNGWPWIENNAVFPSNISNSITWPKISIITPNFNYAGFIEETIRSVLLQGYPNLEYIIIDDGSTDNSVEIIRKYAGWLTYWENRPNQGQTNAINKGFSLCSGEIFAWLDSDNVYCPDCLKMVAEMYKRGYEFIVGSCLDIDREGNAIREYDKFYKNPHLVNFGQYLKFWSGVFFPQSAVFISKSLADNCFPLDDSLFYAMDYQLFLRAIYKKPKSICLKQIFVKTRFHGANKGLVYKNKVSEFERVALSESEKNPVYLTRKIFRVVLRDMVILNSIIQYQSYPRFSDLAAHFFMRPTLICHVLFFKLVARALLGKKAYLYLKRVLKKKKAQSL